MLSGPLLSGPLVAGPRLAGRLLRRWLLADIGGAGGVDGAGDCPASYRGGAGGGGGGWGPRTATSPASCSFLTGTYRIDP